MKKSFLEKTEFRQASETGKYAALYVRVSTEEWVWTTDKDGKPVKDRRASVNSQINILKAYAEKRGWEYKIFDGDCDISGYKGFEKRKDLQAIVNEIEAGNIHHIVVREIKRLSRRQNFMSNLIDNVLMVKGVDISSTSESMVSIATLDGRRLIIEKAGQGEADLQYNAIHSKASRDLKAKEGTLRITPPTGYEIIERRGIRNCFIVEEEAELIKELFRRYIAGEGVRKICIDFNNRGLKTKKGNMFHTRHLMHCIHQTIYKLSLIHI